MGGGEASEEDDEGGGLLGGKEVSCLEIRFLLWVEGLTKRMAPA